MQLKENLKVELRTVSKNTHNCYIGNAFISNQKYSVFTSKIFEKND